MRDNRPYEIKDGVEHCIEDEVPFEIPERWGWVRLENLGILSAGKTPQINQLSDTGEIPYFKVSDMNNPKNQIYLQHSNNYLNINYNGTIYPKNSIVFPKNGGAIFTNKKRILNQDSLVDLNTGIFILFDYNLLNYIFLFFKMIDFKHFYKGTALPTLDYQSMNEIFIPLPPIQEQHRIVEKIEQLFSQVDHLKI